MLGLFFCKTHPSNSHRASHRAKAETATVTVRLWQPPQLLLPSPPLPLLLPPPLLLPLQCLYRCQRPLLLPLSLLC